MTIGKAEALDLVLLTLKHRYPSKGQGVQNGVKGRGGWAVSFMNGSEVQRGCRMLIFR